jgi:hypothetical protein
MIYIRREGHAGISGRGAGNIRMDLRITGEQVEAAAQGGTGRGRVAMSVNQDSGMRVLEDPLTNKGTAFTEAERSELGLRGLVPTAVETLDQQARRSAPMQIGDARIPVAQCNNVYIFPGVGLVVTAVRATRITDAMMTAAARTLAAAAPSHHDPHGMLLPGRAQLPDIALLVAAAVAGAAVAGAPAPALTADQIGQAIL